MLILPPPKFHTLEIAITDFCNLKCPFCSQGTPLQKDRKVISLKDIRAYSRYFRPHEFYRIKISGGEPTLHPEFREICTELRTLFPAQEYVIATNGAKLLDFLDLLPVFDVVGLTHYAGRNDKVIAELAAAGVAATDKLDGKELDDVYVFGSPERNKFRRCVFTTAVKIVQDRLYPCCVAFGESVRHNYRREVVSVPIDAAWRRNLRRIWRDMDMICRNCFVDLRKYALPERHRTLPERAVRKRFRICRNMLGWESRV